MPDIDLFNFFRWSLGTVVTIYATLMTVQWAASWYKYLSQPGRATSMLSRYIWVHGLRMKLIRHSGDVLICVLLCVIFVILLHAHGILADIGARLSDARSSSRHLRSLGA